MKSSPHNNGPTLQIALDQALDSVEKVVGRMVKNFKVDQFAVSEGIRHVKIGISLLKSSIR